MTDLYKFQPLDIEALFLTLETKIQLTVIAPNHTNFPQFRVLD